MPRVRGWAVRLTLRDNSVRDNSVREWCNVKRQICRMFSVRSLGTNFGNRRRLTCVFERIRLALGRRGRAFVLYDRFAKSPKGTCAPRDSHVGRVCDDDVVLEVLRRLLAGFVRF